MTDLIDDSIDVKWSFSSLKDFTNCPRQYHEVKVLRRFTKKATSQIIYGNHVHKAIEHYTLHKTPLPKHYERFQGMVDPLLEIEGERYPERKMALRQDRTPCDFNAEDYWVRGIIDLLVIDGDTAFIVDYKTGSARYPDLKQLKLMALLTYAHHPEVVRIKAGLLFLVNNLFLDEEYSRDQIDNMWSIFTPELKRLQTALDNSVWTPNPTPLCGWCPVTTCEYHNGVTRA